jgi:hypothetical protein
LQGISEGRENKTRHFWRVDCSFQNTSGAFALFILVLARSRGTALLVFFIVLLLIGAVPILLLLFGLILTALMAGSCVLFVCHYSFPPASN